VYATQPTVEMGRVVCLSEAESWRAECPVPEVEDDSMAVDDAVLNKDKGKKPFRGPFVPTVEQIHEAFDWIKATRYNQPLHLGGELWRYRQKLTAQASSRICSSRRSRQDTSLVERSSRSVHRRRVLCSTLSA